MTIDQWITIAIIIIAVILFITEWLSVDLIGLIIISLLIISGVITPVDAVGGFSNSATITIMAMYGLSAAILNTGELVNVGNYLSKVLVKNKTKGILLIMIFAGVISAFINNTPVVAVFIPIILAASAKANISPSKILIPLSFASMFGGLCSLIGTSTNILVSGIAQTEGLAPFGMFEMAPVGIILFVVGVLYLLFAGDKLIPERTLSNQLTKNYDMGKYLTDIRILPDAPSIGKTIAESTIITDLKIDVIGFRRKEEHFTEPNYSTMVEAGDILRLSCNFKQISTIQQREGVEIIQGNIISDEELKTKDITLAEVLVTPGSELQGKTISQARFKHQFGAVAIAIRSRRGILHTRLTRTKLRPGDILLLRGNNEIFAEYKNWTHEIENPFIIISEKEEKIAVNKRNMLIVFSILALVVLLPSFNILPILASAILGVTALVLFRSITMAQLYKAINWNIIFLLAGTISLGIAMEKTGTANLMAENILSVFGSWGPIALVSILYLVTTILTELISNSASAVLLTPIAISMAHTMEVDAKPFLFAIMFAASASFMTPVGYQTNTMIYTAGNYKFIDFFRVGAPLNLIFWILASILIPLFYKF
nr:SLC13 family permease [Pseudopedobacter sp.]